MQKLKINQEVLTNHVKGLLLERGVSIEAIAEVVLFAQEKYQPDLTINEATVVIENILTKREVQNAIITGVELDKAAEEGRIADPFLQEMIAGDDGLYGTDEVINFGVINNYGTVAFTNFGYLDKVKPGIIGILDNHQPDGRVHTFMDDIVCAIAASACGKLAHDKRTEQEYQ